MEILELLENLVVRISNTVFICCSAVLLLLITSCLLSTIATSGPLSIFNLEADEELTYSSKYFQIHRLISLLKMLTTALYLECALTAVLILVVFAGDYFGNLYLYFFLKLMVVVFPFLYLVCLRLLK